MLRSCLTAFILISAAPAAAESTGTVSAPALNTRQQPIILLGHTGTPQKQSELRTGTELEFRKTKKRRLPKKEKTAVPAAKKLIPVHFKEEPSHKTPYTCRWVLGKFFELLGGSPQKQTPEPRPVQLQPAAKPKD